MIDHTTLPTKPGCYLYKNTQDKVIYVGKAKNLKKRVSSYFTKAHQDDKTKELVKNIRGVDFFVTSTEVEALVLENNLIKKYQPKYNISLKNSQRYAYIILTNEEFPQLTIARNKNLKGKYYGPFVSAYNRDQVLKVLRAKFQIRTCKKLPKKECLRYHIGLCSAPCIGKISKTEYNKRLSYVDSFLKGKTKTVTQVLHDQMRYYSSKQQYEQAKLARDQLHAINFLHEKQQVEKDRAYDQDIINYVVQEGKVYLIVFNALKGMLTSKHEFTFDFRANFLDEFLSQFYTTRQIPKEIVLPHPIGDLSLKLYFEKLRGNKVLLTLPEKGTKKHLLELVKQNIEQGLLRSNKQLTDLQERLQLNGPPNIIECFDIAHISGTSSVGSMVQFSNGKPNNSQYRKFKIKTVEGNDDFSSIAEVVRRRYHRLKEEGKEMPDLIVIDGGKGQLRAACAELRELDLKIPIIALAKQFEKVYVPGLRSALAIPQNASGLQLLRHMRDEAHRFAQNYHKLLRTKKMKNQSKWE